MKGYERAMMLQVFLRPWDECFALILYHLASSGNIRESKFTKKLNRPHVSHIINDL